MTETQIMFEKIHENERKVRALNIKRAKKKKIANLSLYLV